MGKYALLIGVGEYGEGLQPLPAAPLDVAALAQVLQNPDVGGFDDVQSLANPSQPEMARAIELWFSARQPEDLVLLFFSGHGVKDDRLDLYFTACNTEKVNNRLVRSTATPARFVHDCIRGCKARQQVIILDCCFSGAFGELTAKDDGAIDLESQLGAEGRVVLTSTSAVDYSFEDKGADLSIYTRYLVEGLQTGAADADGDGVIVVEELHRYASRKVAESSPAMTPKIITLKDEGYRIALARSPQDDPRLKYRKEVEQRARQGTLSRAARQLLNLRQAELGIAETEAFAIEVEVLKPYQDYQHKLKEYRQTLAECLKHERTLSPGTIQDLQDLWQHQRLNLEDVVPIEQEILGHSLSGQAFTAVTSDLTNASSVVPIPKKTAKVVEDGPSTERGNNYIKLQNFLKAEEWKFADTETLNILLRQSNRQDQGWLRPEDIADIPAKTFEYIDDLWTQYSNGKFGFSVQKTIWESCGSPLTVNSDWEKFGERIGWRRSGDWLPYIDLMFNIKAPIGQFPAAGTATLRSVIGRGKPLVTLFKRSDINFVSPHTDDGEDNLSSEKEVDYTRLRDLLRAGQWKEADLETAYRMLEAVGRTSDDWIRAKELQNFPCEDLRTIDQLWVKYSYGKWGFSVQKRIYVECGAKLDCKYPGNTIWYEFCQRVGWRKSNSWMNYSNLTFDLYKSPTGELPLGHDVWKLRVREVWVFSSLVSRLVNCSG